MAREKSLKELQDDKAVLVARMNEINVVIERDYAHIAHSGEQQPGLEYESFLNLQQELQGIIEQIRVIGDLIRIKQKGK